MAGPIYPIWPHAQPEWLPHKYVGCLTILDHIKNDRWLSGNEVAFGTNMAFKADVLREIGGFNVGLGRRGAHSLLSEEEVEAQLALRQRGHRTFYAAAAGVDHAVHPDRLTRNYFRARMAWQAVSALLRDPPLQHSDWSQREIRTAADKLGLRELISKLMTDGDAQTFSAQLDFIYHLFAILLESKDLDDLSVEGMFAASSDMPTIERPYRPSRDAYLPVPAECSHSAYHQTPHRGGKARAFFSLCSLRTVGGQSAPGVSATDVAQLRRAFGVRPTLYYTSGGNAHVCDSRATRLRSEQTGFH